MADKNQATRLGCACLFFSILAFGFVISFLGNTLGGLVQIVWALLTGWIFFLARTMPQMSGNISIAAMAILCAALALVLGHAFLSWFNGAISGEEKSNSWKFRWTFCGFVSVVVLFVIGMAAGGVVHQLGWIATSPGTILESDWKNSNSRRYYQQDFLLTGFLYSRSTHEHNLQAAINDFHDSIARRDFSGSGSALLEEYQLFVIVDTDDPNQYLGMLIFSRQRPPAGKLIGLLDLDDNQRPSEIKSETELQQHLKTYRDQLVPLTTQGEGK